MCEGGIFSGRFLLDYFVSIMSGACRAQGPNLSIYLATSPKRSISIKLCISTYALLRVNLYPPSSSVADSAHVRVRTFGSDLKMVTHQARY